jgi:hypothetical protein
MKECLYLGAVPYEEVGSSVGSDNYYHRMLIETTAYIGQLKRIIKTLGLVTPDNVFIVRNSSYHEFGTYYDVVVEYNSDDIIAEQFAYTLEANVPAYWDLESKIILETMKDDWS